MGHRRSHRKGSVDGASGNGKPRAEQETVKKRGEPLSELAGRVSRNLASQEKGYSTVSGRKGRDWDGSEPDERSVRKALERRAARQELEIQQNKVEQKQQGGNPERFRCEVTDYFPVVFNCEVYNVTRVPVDQEGRCAKECGFAKYKTRRLSGGY